MSTLYTTCLLAAILSLTLLLGGSTSTIALVPPVISYQGLLTDSSANPKNGLHDFRVKFYSAPSAGITFYEETFTTQPVVQGIFSLNLGTGTPLSGSFGAIDFSNPVYITLNIKSSISVVYDGETNPRTLLRSNPYSQNSNQLQGRTVGTLPNNIVALDGTSNLTLPNNLTTAGILTTGTGLIPITTTLGNLDANALTLNDNSLQVTGTSLSVRNSLGGGLVTTGTGLGLNDQCQNEQGLRWLISAWQCDDYLLSSLPGALLESQIQASSSDGYVLTSQGGSTVWAAPTGSGWSLLGNSGTNPTINFIGTTDAQNLSFRTNNIEQLNLSQSGRVSFSNALGDIFLNGGNETTTGGNNIGIGSGSASAVGTGFNNIGLGQNSLAFNTAGSGNLAIGQASLLFTQGDLNTAIGQGAGILTNGNNNTFIGYAAAQGMTAGSRNIAIGQSTVFPNATGSDQLNIGNWIFGTNGLIGIGNSTPSEQLDVQGNIKFSGALMPAGLSGTSGQVLFSSGVGVAPIWGSSSNLLRYYSESVAIPDSGPVSTGTKSIAIGDSAQALSSYSNAFGSYNIASSDFSSAFGYSNVASGNLAVAFGYNNLASNQQAGAFGQSNITSGNTALAFGRSNQVISDFSEAFGRGNYIDSGTNLSVFGRGIDTTAGYWLGTSVGSVLIGSTNGGVTVLTDGKVGVGTTSPTEILQVQGNLRISGALMPGNLAGTSGQILVSQGVGVAPVWSNNSLLTTNSLSFSGLTSVLTSVVNGVSSNTSLSALQSPITIQNTSSLFATGLSNPSGVGATGATDSIFLGRETGNAAVNATNSIFLGRRSGTNATNALVSNFIGVASGNSATNASFSNFLGQAAGNSATNAANSIFIGNNSGSSDTVNNTLGGTSILIGDFTNTGGFSNSIALGEGAINTATNQFYLRDAITNFNLAGVNYTLPTTQGVVGTVLSNNGSGLLSWDLPGVGSNWSLTGNGGTNPVTNFIGTTDAQSLIFRTNNVERIGILANGNVGIGTNNPSHKLSVIGNVTTDVVTIENTNPNGFATMRLRNDVGNQAFFGLSGSAISTFPNSWYVTRTGAPSDSIVLTSSGNFGVGVAVPAAKLEVNSGILNTSGLRLTNLTSFSPTSTGQAIGVDTLGNVVSLTPALGSSPITIQNTSSLFSTGLPNPAGVGAAAIESIFLGQFAGEGSTNANYSNFIGRGAGFLAGNANNSNFLGLNAGDIALNASDSNFFGAFAGQSAGNASNSNFFGRQAGTNATNAANSFFIGNNAGLNDIVDNTLGGTSILIGDNTSTGGFSNSIALGANAINTATNQFLVGPSYTDFNFRGVNYVMPSAQAVSSGLTLVNDGIGNLSWGPSLLTGWSTTGNTILGGEFLGTLNAQDLVINSNSGLGGLSTTGAISVGDGQSGADTLISFGSNSTSSTTQTINIGQNFNNPGAIQTLAIGSNGTNAINSLSLGDSSGSGFGQFISVGGTYGGAAGTFQQVYLGSGGGFSGGASQTVSIGSGNSLDGSTQTIQIGQNTLTNGATQLISIGSGVSNVSNNVVFSTSRVRLQSALTLEGATFGDLPTGGDLDLPFINSDYTSMYTVNQNTPGQTITLTTPAFSAVGNIAYVQNTGTVSFNMYGRIIPIGEGRQFVWNGSGWAPQSSLPGTVCSGTNTCVGDGALGALTTGQNNSAFGNDALKMNEDGNGNTAIGIAVMESNIDGSNNVALGGYALTGNISGFSNTAIGVSSLRLTTGNSNSAVGDSAGQDLTSGQQNSFFGTGAGMGITTGSYNTIIGASVNSLPAGLSNTVIIADGQGNRRIVANNLGQVSIGTNVATNRLTIEDLLTTNVSRFNGSGSTQCTVVTGTGWSCSSDERLKKNIVSLDSAANLINQLRPVTYQWKQGSTETQYGFIAQEVEQVIPGLVSTNESGFKSLNMQGITPYLVKAFQEQQQEIEEIKIQLGLITVPTSNLSVQHQTQILGILDRLGLVEQKNTEQDSELNLLKTKNQLYQTQLELQELRINDLESKLNQLIITP